jgi:hypothetical protein
MNRRNFILGLGTAATLSGAASVTGASLSSSVDSGANFQVIAENNLDIRRNDDTLTDGTSGGLETASNGEILNDTYDNYVNTSVSYINETEGEGNLNSTIGSGIEDVNGPRLSINDAENGNLQMALATQNDASLEDNQNLSSSGTASPYNGTSASAPPNATAPLEIVNQGGSDVEVSASYTYGEDANGGTGDIPESTVAQLFTFEIPGSQTGVTSGGGQVSPASGSNSEATSSGDENGNSATIGSGEAAVVNFTINYSESIAEEISNQSGGSYSFGDTAFQSVNLLNQVTFGTVNQ